MNYREAPAAENVNFRTEYTCNGRGGCDFSTAVTAVMNSSLSEKDRSRALLLIETVKDEATTHNMDGFSYNKEYEKSLFYLENKTPREARRDGKTTVGYVHRENLDRLEAQMASNRSWLSRFWPWS